MTVTSRPQGGGWPGPRKVQVTIRLDPALRGRAVEHAGLYQEGNLSALVASALTEYLDRHDQPAEETQMSITDQQISDLRSEAGTAGDTEMVRVCDAALAGDTRARAECAQVIADAAAMATEETR